MSLSDDLRKLGLKPGDARDFVEFGAGWMEANLRAGRTDGERE